MLLKENNFIMTNSQKETLSKWQNDTKSQVKLNRDNLPIVINFNNKIYILAYDKNVELTLTNYQM